MENRILPNANAEIILDKYIYALYVGEYITLILTAFISSSVNEFDTNWEINKHKNKKTNQK